MKDRADIGSSCVCTALLIKKVYMVHLVERKLDVKDLDVMRHMKNIYRRIVMR